MTLSPCDCALRDSLSHGHHIQTGVPARLCLVHSVPEGWWGGGLLVDPEDECDRIIRPHSDHNRGLTGRCPLRHPPTSGVQPVVPGPTPEDRGLVLVILHLNRDRSVAHGHDLDTGAGAAFHLVGPEGDANHGGWGDWSDDGRLHHRDSSGRRGRAFAPPAGGRGWRGRRGRSCLGSGD